MSNLDLDISNYSIKDLEKFFQLKKKYSESDVEYQEYEIRERLLSSGHVDKRFKKDLIDFLHEGKQWLIYSKFGQKQNVSTTNSNEFGQKQNVSTTNSNEFGQKQNVSTTNSNEFGQKQNVSSTNSNEFGQKQNVSTTNSNEFGQRQNPTITNQNYTSTSKQQSHPFHSNIEETREHELKSHPNKQFVQSNNSDFYSGTLNPLNVRIVSKYITIDSRFRDNTCTKTSDFTIQLPTTINKVVSMQLTALEMPITFYGISSSYGNNYLYMYANQQTVVDGPITESKIVIVIPDGNYIATDLISTINKLLAPTDDSGNLTDPTSVFSYVHLVLDITEKGSGSGKVTIQPKYAFDLAYTILCLGLDFGKNINGENDNIDITTKIGWNLGFTQKIYSGSPTYLANAPINPASMRYVYLSIGDYQRNVNKLFLTAYHQTNLNDDTLARISLKTGAFSMLMENDFHLITEPRIYFGPVDIAKLRIQLFDDHGRPLNTNQTDYSFVLLFKMVYDL